MNKNARILFGILAVIIILGATSYYFLYKKDGITDESIKKEAKITGCYVAKIGKDVYALNIENESNKDVSGMLAYNNYQKDSSSGFFSGNFSNDILLGNYFFDSEGMRSDSQVIFKKMGDDFIQGFGPIKLENGNKVRFDDIKKINFDSKNVFKRTTNCTITFTDQNGIFSFDYNALFKLSEGDTMSTKDWRSNATQFGILRGRISVPKIYMPGTNFFGALFTVGQSTDMNAIRNCAVRDANETAEGEENIGGYPFKKLVSTGTAAGNTYETTSYRGLFDGDCYAVEYTIRSGNMDNYSSSQGIKEFDKEKIKNEFEKTIKSFRFLISSD